MKIDAKTLPRVMANPTAWRVILFHGDDMGLIQERAQTVVETVIGNKENNGKNNRKNDPFRVAVLDRETHTHLEEEATALSLVGGRRVVRVRESVDALVPALQAILAIEPFASTPLNTIPPYETLVVLEAQNLPPRSKLRHFIEERKDCASIGCYPEEGDTLEETMVRILKTRCVYIQPEALRWLSTQLGSHRAIVRSEMEKLALYANDSGTLTLDDVRVCIGDSGQATLEEAAFAATEGKRVEADRSLERALAEGVGAIPIIRVFLAHIQRLRRVRATIDSGIDKVVALKALRPPVFFKRVASFERAIALWSLPDLTQETATWRALEVTCKQTGVPDLLLCRRQVALLGGRAAYYLKQKQKSRCFG